ncbi:unnamed protein product [Microthlaspi erraticum]|uniref:DUF4283 domain-containing protein n=1 Tax=Microthlaspi erraticum TaxID=1685480 RepID=A0A6D2K338_9BRAS|nr:unnamed protein product [Microthlaspi erraticum]
MKLHDNFNCGFGFLYSVNLRCYEVDSSRSQRSVWLLVADFTISWRSYVFNGDGEFGVNDSDFSETDLVRRCTGGSDLADIWGGSRKSYSGKVEVQKWRNKETRGIIFVNERRRIGLTEDTSVQSQVQLRAIPLHRKFRWFQLWNLGSYSDSFRDWIEIRMGFFEIRSYEELQYKNHLKNRHNTHLGFHFHYLGFCSLDFFGLAGIFLCVSSNTLLVLRFPVQGIDMTQGALVGGGASHGGNKKPVSRLKITVPRFDNTALISGYSKTLIGRCMNPSAQDVQALLHHMPRFWKMEDRVGGADLGLGRFQFDFENEEDIAEVFKLEPFHFDYWMVSLVRWEPIVDPAYPSALKFWVRLMGVPLHFWAETTFRCIGEAIGEVLEVDIDGGRVRVCLDGYKHLIFETTVEFHSGEETVVALRYERLFGFCRECSSLCHDVLQCPLLRKAREERENQKRRDEKPDGGMMSYKGVVINGPSGENGNGRNPHANSA